MERDEYKKVERAYLLIVDALDSELEDHEEKALTSINDAMLEMFMRHDETRYVVRAEEFFDPEDGDRVWKKHAIAASFEWKSDAVEYASNCLQYKGLANEIIEGSLAIAVYEQYKGHLMRCVDLWCDESTGFQRYCCNDCLDHEYDFE